MQTSDILKRIDELLNPGPIQSADAYQVSAELSHGCVSLLTLIYGAESTQIEHFKTSLADIAKEKATIGYKSQMVTEMCLGTLKNLKSEIGSGLIQTLQHAISSEVLTDLIQLSRTVLANPGDDAKNVAAVLAAAAFEDTVRRMGKTFAGVIGKDDLADVLKKLKDADVLKSPQVGIAQSYLSFRNHALHANWENIQRESVQSILGFVEQLLIKHFS